MAVATVVVLQLHLPATTVAAPQLVHALLRRMAACQLTKHRLAVRIDCMLVGVLEHLLLQLLPYRGHVLLCVVLMICHLQTFYRWAIAGCLFCLVAGAGTPWWFLS